MTNKVKGMLIQPADIVRVVADHLGLEYADIMGGKRDSYVVHARHISMKLVKDLVPRQTYISLASFFECDHTTVMHAVGAMKQFENRFPGRKGLYGIILEKIDREGW